MLEKPILVYRKTSLFGFMRSFSWFGLVLSGLLFLGEWRLGDFLSLQFAAILVIFPIFLLMTISLFRKGSGRRPLVELRPEGLLARDISRDVIDWTEIDNVEVSRVYGQDILNLSISREALAGLSLTVPAQISQMINALFGASVVSINLANMEWDAEYLAGVIAREAEAGRGDLDALLPEDEE